MIAHKAASSRPCDVLLVSGDNELRAAVRRQRPAGLRLMCIDPHTAAEAARRAGGELWVDLDGGAAGELLPRAAVCFQSPPAAAGPRSSPGGDALLVRKPCSAAVARRLWRAVACERPDAHGPADAEAALPAWMSEFHALGLRELSRLCVQRLPRRLGYADASLYLHDPQTGILSLAETTHRRPIDAAVNMAADREHLMVDVARSGRLLRTANARRQRQARALPAPRRAAYADGACLIAPLLCDGQLWGLLNFSGRQPAGRRCPPRPEPIFEFLGRALRYAREYERAHLEARIDALTGLYNQRWMREALEKEIRRSERFAIPLSLIAADLDGLKAVNDRQGHPAGDCVLRHAARRISCVLRQFDSAARVGGDEFTILLPATALEGARQVARRVLESIRHDAALFGGVPLPIRASLGVAQWEPGWESPRLSEAADQALYAAKNQGRDQLVCRQRGAGSREESCQLSAISSQPEGRRVPGADRSCQLSIASCQPEERRPPELGAEEGVMR